MQEDLDKTKLGRNERGKYYYYYKKCSEYDTFNSLSFRK